MSACVCMNVCASQACSAIRGQNRTADSVEVEIQVIESHSVSSGTDPGSSAKLTSFLKDQAIYPDVSFDLLPKIKKNSV